jgi:hypothetical protein
MSFGGPTEFTSLRVGGNDVVPLPTFSPFAQHWYVNTNLTGTGDGSKTNPYTTMTLAFNNSRLLGGDVIHCVGNVTEHLTMPTGKPDLTIIGEGTRPRHADTHPLNGEDSSFTWKSGGTNSPLVTVVCPGCRFINILFAAHASNAAILLTRNAVEDATEIDASHASILGCRFASGGYGIRDTGGTFNVRVEGNVFGAVTEAILGVGNVGVGQLQWHIRNNHFNNMTNGVKIAAHECVIEGNFFTDGGTPNTTYVLNTSNGGGRDNFVVRNIFQGTTANFNTPDVVGNATDVWYNHALDTASAGVSGVFEVGQPA